MDGVVSREYEMEPEREATVPKEVMRGENHLSTDLQENVLVLESKPIPRPNYAPPTTRSFFRNVEHMI